MAYIAGEEDNMTFQDLIVKDYTESLQKVAQKLYGRYMAQAFSNNMRMDPLIDGAIMEAKHHPAQNPSHLDADRRGRTH
ncbi:hypothetical protein E8E11_004186 [Didymella keratinophila]|nr:hypothetical protein E8E11_004186 [Didymella keratinophila]